MSDPLRDLLGELAGDQPDVPDWAGEVRGLVAARRHRRRIVTAAAAVALVVGGGGVAVLASAPPAPETLIGSPDVTPEVSPSPSEASTQETPSPQPSPTPQAPTQAPDPTPVPVVPSEPSPSPTSSYPERGTQDVEITARSSPVRPTVGQEWVLDVTVTGFAESEPFLQQPCIEGEQCQYATHSCAGPRDPSPPPARRQQVDRTFRHTFSSPGPHEVQLLAESGCSYYVGREELLLVVHVDDATTEPSASPTPPTPTPTPSP